MQRSSVSAVFTFVGFVGFEDEKLRGHNIVLFYRHFRHFVTE